MQPENKLALLLALLVGAILFAATAQAEVIADVNETTLYHFAAGSAMGFGGNLLLHHAPDLPARDRRILVFTGCSAVGIGKEIYDMNFDVIDALATIGGCYAGDQVFEHGYLVLTGHAVHYVRRW